jgi:hypothetical protein
MKPRSSSQPQESDSRPVPSVTASSGWITARDVHDPIGLQALTPQV